MRAASENCALRYWDRLIGPASAADRDLIADPGEPCDLPMNYSGNIENYIGTVKVPGWRHRPTTCDGHQCSWRLSRPSCHDRSCPRRILRTWCICRYQGRRDQHCRFVRRRDAHPAFVLGNILDAGLFVEWVANNIATLRNAAESTTRYGKLTAVEPVIDNDIVFLICRYTTGDASGQNMVTIATHALCEKIVADCTVPINRWYIEGNFSGDKKASALGLMTGRGRKVSASVVLPAAIIKKVLGTTAQDMLAYGRIADLGAKLSGQMGAQAHYANGLAALYIATGQDAACVAESAMGFTRMEARGDDLFCSVTMPNILVGSVGGGTAYPAKVQG